MSGRKSSRRTVAKRGVPTMREIESDVRKSVSKEDKYSSLRPGEFNDDDMRILKHPSGLLLRLSEWDIELADAVNIVRAGADVYVNPGDYPFRVQGTVYERERQWWLLGDDALALERATARTGKNDAPLRISLYKSDQGVFAIHLTGAFDWSEG